MRTANKIGLLVVLTALAVVGCTSVKTKRVDTNDMSYLYNPILNKLHPRYRVFNDNENKSTLSVKLYANDLYFSEANPEGTPKASLRIFLRLYNLNQGRVIVDTAFYNIPIAKIQGKREYIFNFPINSPQGPKYEIELILRDAIRNTAVQSHIPFDRSEGASKNNFIVRGHFNKLEIFTPILRDGDFVNLLYPNRVLDTLYLSYFNPYDDIPDAPSMLVPEKELSLEPQNRVKLAYSDTLPIMFPNRGVYLFSPDSVGLNGYAVFNFGKTYPTMVDPETMIYPLIYLSSFSRVNEMLSASNKKIALDEFWLTVSNSVERSRELVRIYYNRVLYANYFFSSYREGWRTDRGMIYIIYGPPDKVYKTSEGEKWGYNKPVVKSGWGIRYKVKDEFLYFSFAKRENPFTENSYTLIRNESVTTYWDQAIRSWLSGIVFRLDNPSDL